MQVDVLIVGAGPSGLYAAYYAGFRGLSVAIIDGLPEAGGQITALYPEKQIYDVAGFPAIKGKDLVDNLVAQAAPFNPHYLLGEQAIGYQALEDGVVITTASGKEVRAGAVVVTGGIGTFTPRPLPGGDEWVGAGLEYIVPDLRALRRQGRRRRRWRRQRGRLGARARGGRRFGDARAPA